MNNFYRGAKLVRDALGRLRKDSDRTDLAPER
jgi:hypothetical protein